MARRSEHSQEEIKEMVLKAAESIVIKEGFAELKVRKIALQIGYTVGSIYMVFDNMADLIMQIKGRTLDDLAEQLNQTIVTDNMKQNIELLAKTYLSFSISNFNRWSMIFEHNPVDEDAIPDWYKLKTNTAFKCVEAQFKQLPTEHSKEQSILAARALWCGVHGICSLSLPEKSDLLGISNVENTVVLLVDNFIRGWVSS